MQDMKQSFVSSDPNEFGLIEVLCSTIISTIQRFNDSRRWHQE